jgi:hypothetical protein
MQTKFYWNPLQIYVIGLTKSLFVHYCLVDNSYKSNIVTFNYKILCKIKSPNFACILMSYAVACTK